MEQAVAVLSSYEENAKWLNKHHEELKKEVQQRMGCSPKQDRYRPRL
jgi:hypothetical protein